MTAGYRSALAEFAALSDAECVRCLSTFNGVQTTMKIVDYLAEVELKTAEQLVKEVFDVRPTRDCHAVIDPKIRKAGKRQRMAQLVVSLKAKAAGAGR